jgi:hypothetical protein
LSAEQQAPYYAKTGQYAEDWAAAHPVKVVEKNMEGPEKKTK